MSQIKEKPASSDMVEGQVDPIKTVEARYRDAVIRFLLSSHSGQRLVPEDISESVLQRMPIELLEALVNTGTSFITMRIQTGMIWFRPADLSDVKITYEVDDPEFNRIDPEGHANYCNVVYTDSGGRHFRQILPSYYSSELLLIFATIVSHHTHFGLSLQFQRFSEYAAQQVVQVTSKNVVGE